MNLLDQFSEALTEYNSVIRSFDPDKPRGVATKVRKVTAKLFCADLRDKIANDNTAKYAQLLAVLCNEVRAIDLIYEYAEKNNLLKMPKGTPLANIPDEHKNSKLYLNISAKKHEDRFFVTYEDGTISLLSGANYLLLHQLDEKEAASLAKMVLPKYLPRTGPGEHLLKINGKDTPVLNVYRQPPWVGYANWDKLPNKLPKSFKILIEHLILREEEQDVFYDWLHESLFKRAYVFLILCGAPGIGKNTLKLVMRALHGHENTVDGKKSTITDKFNSQYTEATLVWFDELDYNSSMENAMKEIQNDTISIERKSVDATKGTKIFASAVISNNKPRDNYIGFDARKFVPLQLNCERLEMSMSSEEIDKLTKKVVDAESLDVAYVAQIAKWLKKRGVSGKWKNLEYKGPMFWTLAHTSMTRWQKLALMIISGSDLKPSNTRTVPTSRSKLNRNENGAYLWSDIFAQIRKIDKYDKGPEFTSAKAFFEIFRDGSGQKAFSTESVSGVNYLNDFWITPIIEQPPIITEAMVAEQREGANENAAKETDYL